MKVEDLMGQCITFNFQIEKKEVWFLIIYDANEAAVMKDLWAHLEDVYIIESWTEAMDNGW